MHFLICEHIACIDADIVRLGSSHARMNPRFQWIHSNVSAIQNDCGKIAMSNRNMRIEMEYTDLCSKFA